VRQSGQLNSDLYEPRSLRNAEVDVLVKYKGWAWYNEYMTRDTDNPVTVSAADPTKTRFVYVGEGYLSQLSYLFKNNFEVAGRYTAIRPFVSLYENTSFPALNEKKIEQVEVGVTKYLNGHRLKVQGNVIYNTRTELVNDSFSGGFWSAVFQVELGI
jgi:hypothetical protein